MPPRSAREAILIQADKLVSYDGDPVTHYGEGHGYVVVRCKRQVKLDAVYCFKQARENFYDCLFPLERGCQAMYRLFVASGSMRGIVSTETAVYWCTNDAQTMAWIVEPKTVVIKRADRLFYGQPLAPP
jgi:hypothetical protein